MEKLVVRQGKIHQGKGRASKTYKTERNPFEEDPKTPASWDNTLSLAQGICQPKRDLKSDL